MLLHLLHLALFFDLLLHDQCSILFLLQLRLNRRCVEFRLNQLLFELGDLVTQLGNSVFPFGDKLPLFFLGTLQRIVKRPDGVLVVVELVLS